MGSWSSRRGLTARGERRPSSKTGERAVKAASIGGGAPAPAVRPHDHSNHSCSHRDETKELNPIAADLSRAP